MNDVGRLAVERAGPDHLVGVTSILDELQHGGVKGSVRRPHAPGYPAGPAPAAGSAPEPCRRRAHEVGLLNPVDPYPAGGYTRDHVVGIDGKVFDSPLRTLDTERVDKATG